MLKLCQYCAFLIVVRPDGKEPVGRFEAKKKTIREAGIIGHYSHFEGGSDERIESCAVNSPAWVAMRKNTLKDKLKTSVWTFYQSCLDKIGISIPIIKPIKPYNDKYCKDFIENSVLRDTALALREDRKSNWLAQNAIIISFIALLVALGSWFF